MKSEEINKKIENSEEIFDPWNPGSEITTTITVSNSNLNNELYQTDSEEENSLEEILSELNIKENLIWSKENDFSSVNNNDRETISESKKNKVKNIKMISQLLINEIFTIETLREPKKNKENLIIYSLLFIIFWIIFNLKDFLSFLFSLFITILLNFILDYYISKKTYNYLLISIQILLSLFLNLLFKKLKRKKYKKI